MIRRTKHDLWIERSADASPLSPRMAWQEAAPSTLSIISEFKELQQ